MGLDLTIQPKKEYLHIISRGQQTYPDLINGWKRILKASRKHRLPAILYESHAEKACTHDIVNFAVHFTQLDLSGKVCIGALCSEDNYADMTFARTVIHRRVNLPIDVFTSKREALKWLMKSHKCTSK